MSDRLSEHQIPGLTATGEFGIISINDISTDDILEAWLMRTENSEDFQPLSEMTLYILVSLAPGPLHGYAIAKKVRALSEDRVILSVSTLYTILKRLLENGWIERVGEDAELDESGRPRKTYALTERGQRLLAREKMRLHSLLVMVQEQTAGEGI
jgi:PadR family transcriptional regulator PadR